jgi:hypothetical protein
MNISTGGPHILLFERDQQLTALLISEFQLAGYQCHTARTAVEVFDTIARYPIRLVLVNLAQAAAARREFWVALDTQRRGRGVQILTFHCTNLAGYGARDSEDRSQTTLADMEVDGMLGLMNLVDAVRIRVPGVGSTTNTLPHIAKTPAAIPTIISQVSPSPQVLSSQSPSMTSPAVAQSAQTTGKQPAITANGYATSGSIAPHVGSSLDVQGNKIDQELDGHTVPSQFSSSLAGQPSAATNQATVSPSSSSTSATGGQSYTEKIRAVLYPNQRASHARSSATTVREAHRPAYETPDTQQIPTEIATASSPVPSPTDTSTLPHLANGYRETEGQPESSLAQLSRMVQEHRAPPVEESRNNSPTQVSEQTNVQILRTSPIQDVPVERAMGGQAADGVRRSDGLPRAQYAQQSPQQMTPPPIAALASLATPLPPSPSISIASLTSQPIELETEEYTEEDRGEPTGALPAEDVEEIDNAKDDSMPTEQEVQVQEAGMASGNVSLSDIMQSLPPMSPSLPMQTPQLPQQPSQQQQPQGVSGRAIRSLGSVLLEGHLVPQSRLEVAQNIQRLWRGVDLSYQLGEILLMFKLLTPDQLLAASLVSYGLITTQQIVALGRIRQELHAIGLEYDLESLLILFRLLTPEQLREVRSSWQG